MFILSLLLQMYPPDIDIIAMSAHALANAQHAQAQQLQHLSRHKGALVETTVRGMDRSAPASTVGPQEMSVAAAEERTLVNRLSHSQAQHDTQQVRVLRVSKCTACFCQREAHAGALCNKGSPRTETHLTRKRHTYSRFSVVISIAVLDKRAP